MLITAAILAALAIPLLFLGLRGRRVDDHPVCRKCKFDLVGVYPETTVCPECGRDQVESAPRTGNRRKRWRVVLAAGLLLVGGATLSGLEVRAIVSEHGWVRLEPMFWLKRDVLSDNGATIARATRELWWRVEERGLDTATLRGSIERVLDRQAELGRSWNPAWGYFVESARSFGAVTDEQWVRYAQGIYRNLKLVPRSPVRVGDVVPYTIQGEARCSQSAPLAAVFRIMPYAVDGERSKIIVQNEYDDPWNEAHPGARPYIQGMVNSNWSPPGMSMQIMDLDPLQSFTWRLDYAKSKAVGESVLDMHLYAYIFDNPEYPSPLYNAHQRDPSEAIATQEFDLSAAFEVVSPETSTVTLITDQTIAPMVSSKSTTVSRGPRGLWRCVGYLDTVKNGVGVAFEVYWRAGDREWFVGSACSAGSVGDFGQLGLGYWRLLEGFDPVQFPTVDIILRPSPRIAHQTPNMVEIWGEEIIIKDVRLEGPGIETPPPSAAGNP